MTSRAKFATKLVKMHDPITRYDGFLSYNWRDHAAVETVAHALRNRGLTVFLDRWYLVPGRPWHQALEEILGTCRAVAVFLGPYGMGPWQQREKGLALNRQARDLTFPVIPVLLPGADPALGFLSLNTWVDLRTGLDNPLLLSVLTAAMRGDPPGPDLQERVAATLATICPYRGLRPFREEDAPFFFGREAYTATLVKALERRPLVAVVGASGSGKSSVVRAGLVPHLRRGDSGRIWDAVTLVPGNSPLHALAAALVPLLEPEMTEVDRLAEVGKLADYLAEGHVALRDVVTRALEKQPGTDRLLLVADQWEELYTLSQGEHARRRFLDEVLEATVQGPLSVVLTLRGDFFGHVLSYRPFADRLQDAVINLGPMTRDELEQAVEAPAQKVGLIFEPGLVHRILDDVEKEPGRLPLMEFVLTGLWEKRHGGRLLHAVYEAMGGVQGAIAQRANEVLKRLTPLEQQVTRRIFVQLVQPGEGTDYTRRRASFAEVGEAARPVVQQLADARLLVTGRDEVTGEEIVEVAHEALTRNWSQFRAWLAEDREFLLWHQRLRGALTDWERTGHDTGVLLRGAPLTEAARWLTERPDDLTPAERGFIQESMALQEQEREARERRRLYTQVTVGSVVLFVILGGWIWWQTEREHKIALSRGLAAQAINLASGQYDLALLLGLAANHLTDILEVRGSLHKVEARGSLLQVLESNPHPITYLRAHKGRVQSVAFSPDGRLLASASFDGTIILWDVATYQPLPPLRLGGRPTKVYSVAFNPVDSQMLASGNEDGTIILWDVATQQPRARLLGYSGEVRSLAFRPDGQMLASSSQDKTIILWDVSTRQPLVQSLTGHTALVGSLAFSSDGQTLASGDDAGKIILWDVASRRQLDRPLTDHTSGVTSVTFSRDGQTLVSGSEDRTILLWDVTRPNDSRMHDRFRAHVSRVLSVALSPDGQTLASGGQESSVMLWDIADPKRRGKPLNGHAKAVRSVAFSPNGQLLASGGDDHTVILWDISARQRLGQPLIGPGNEVFSVAFSPNGQLLASGGDDHEVILWDVAARGLSQRLHGHTAPVRSVAFSLDGQKLASSDRNGTIILWDISMDPWRGQPLIGPRNEVFSVAFSPDGRILASGDKHGTVILWDVGPPGANIGTPRVLDQLHGHTLPVMSVAFSYDGKWLATASGDQAVRVWEIARRQEEVLRDNKLDLVHAVAFNARSQTLALGGSPSTLILWDVTTAISRKQLGRLLSGHTTEVLGVAFRPDGQLLASGSRDGTISLWDVPNGQRLGQPLDGHGDAVHSIAFSPDGKTLASGGSDGTIILRDVSVDSWKARACQIAHRNLTCEEWERYLDNKVPYGKLCPNLPEPEEC
jgi:WD40 repeat protein